MPVSHVFIHHTVMNECFSRRECAIEMRKIQQFHQVKKRWADIGYNFVIGQDGGLYIGRGWDRVGAHTAGWNNVSISFAFTGNFNETLPTDEALNALEAALIVGVKLGKLTPDFKLHGHRDARPTKSPGQKLYDLIRRHKHYEPIRPKLIMFVPKSHA
ncbi:peptidoglycan recognition protein 1-like [Dreissena polymorpha]|nr:peptidoglycan recognition protein 1-like [Dreissena polymorpha]